MNGFALVYERALVLVMAQTHACLSVGFAVPFLGRLRVTPDVGGLVAVDVGDRAVDGLAHIAEFCLIC